MPEPKPRLVLVPIEKAALAPAIFAALNDINERSPLELILLHVWEPLPFTPPEAAYFEEGQLVSYRESAERAANTELESAAACAKAASLPVIRRIIKGGVPAQVILSVASEQTVDWIAVSSHQRKSVSRWFLGSVTERVVAAAPVPVLVVPLAT